MLPRLSSTRPAAGSASEPITVALDGKGGVSLNGQAIDRKRLESRLAALLAGRSDRLILFDAEDDVGYAEAVDILGAIRRAGGRIGWLQRGSAVIHGRTTDPKTHLKTSALWRSLEGCCSQISGSDATA